MGIRNLNKFIIKNSKDGVKNINFEELQNKKIAIDTSIYLYKFLGEGNLVEGVYNMINLFIWYNIKPIFIFDGRAPEEKIDEISKRREEKELAKERYLKLKKEIEETGDNNKILELNNLKKKTLKITNKEVVIVKKMLNMYGLMYLVAEGEADELCAYLVKKEIVWAVLSEDMDLFVCGCPRILRYFDNYKRSLVIYDLNKILNDIRMNLITFQNICILCGSDYKNFNDQLNLFSIMKKYDKCSEKEEFIKNICNIYNIDLNELNKIYYIFTKTNLNYKKYNDIEILYKEADKKRIKNYLLDYNFIFV